MKKICPVCGHIMTNDGCPECRFTHEKSAAPDKNVQKMIMPDNTVRQFRYVNLSPEEKAKKTKIDLLAKYISVFFIGLLFPPAGIIFMIVNDISLVIRRNKPDFIKKEPKYALIWTLAYIAVLFLMFFAVKLYLTY